MTGKCIAYLDDGRICGQPASYVDTQRGGLVCPSHARPTPENVRDRLAKRRVVYPANMPLSTCCGAPLRIAGKQDYQCAQCGLTQGR
jgi:hypothetical protein